MPSVRLKPLSPEALELRKPIPWYMLLGALQERVHRDIGSGRAAKVVRVKGG